jgi:hypothetical protein
MPPVEMYQLGCRVLPFQGNRSLHTLFFEDHVPPIERHCVERYAKRIQFSDDVAVVLADSFLFELPLAELADSEDFFSAAAAFL